MRRLPIGTTLAAAGALVAVLLAGDADRKDINNTKPELGLRDLIGSQYWLKLTFKPTIDWIQDGKTGAVLELEGG